MAKNPKVKARKPKDPTTKDLLARLTQEIADVNRRYRGLFEYVTDPNTFNAQSLSDSIIPFTLDRDMKAGETVNVRVPMKFKV